MFFIPQVSCTVNLYLGNKCLLNDLKLYVTFTSNLQSWSSQSDCLSDYIKVCLARSIAHPFHNNT